MLTRDNPLPLDRSGATYPTAVDRNRPASQRWQLCATVGGVWEAVSVLDERHDDAAKAHDRRLVQRLRGRILSSEIV